MDMVSVNKECVIRHLAAENAQDMEGTLATLHPDCVFEDLPLKKTYYGIDGARQYYKELWSAFDVTVKSRQRHWSTEGNLIAETTLSGRNEVNFSAFRLVDKLYGFLWLLLLRFAMD